MASASIRVFPGTPVLAERIDIEIVSGPTTAKYEVSLDGKPIHSMAANANGNLTESISAAGLEVELANFGTATRDQKNAVWEAGTILGIKESMHSLELRML